MIVKAVFLDRDGVINRRIPGDYVRHPDEFALLEGVAEAIRLFRQSFDCIFIATNQQGIGKGRMTVADLDHVHQYMLHLLEQQGATIDHIYFCPDLVHQQPNCRKPHPAMAFQAQKDYPELNLQRSWMAGDSLSDLQFAWNAGMQPAMIATNPEETQKLEAYLLSNPMPSPPIYTSLLEMAKAIK